MWRKNLRALLPLTAYWFKVLAAIVWEKAVDGYRVLRPRVRLRVCRRGAVRKRDVLLELGGLLFRKELDEKRVKYEREKKEKQARVLALLGLGVILFTTPPQIPFIMPDDARPFLT